MRVDADAVVDASGEFGATGGGVSVLLRVAPGAAWLRDTGPFATWPRGELRLLAIGPAATIDQQASTQPVERFALPGHALLPAFANAHTHLDLTNIGPQPFDPAAGFTGFARTVRAGRPQEPEAVAAAVTAGAVRSLRGGVVAVGDIAGATGGSINTAAALALARSPLFGITFLEFFAIGARAPLRRQQVEQVLDQAVGGIGSSRLEVGLQPHAPYSVDRESYRWALNEAQRRQIRLCTHLAESQDEMELFEHGRGPQRELLEELGLWSSQVAADFGAGVSPVQHLAEILTTARSREVRFGAVHLNHVSDRDISGLAFQPAQRPGDAGVSAIYCPRSSAYFHDCDYYRPHRWCDLRAKHVPVVLGTDSVINLPATQGDRLSTLDEARLIWRQGGADAGSLLAMATCDAAEFLGLRAGAFGLLPAESGGPTREARDLAGLCALPLRSPAGPRGWQRAVLESEECPELLCLAGGDLRA